MIPILLQEPNSEAFRMPGQGQHEENGYSFQVLQRSTGLRTGLPSGKPGGKHLQRYEAWI